MYDFRFRGWGEGRGLSEVEGMESGRIWEGEHPRDPGRRSTWPLVPGWWALQVLGKFLARFGPFSSC